MPDFFSNPRALIAVLCIVGLVLAVNLPLLSLMLGKQNKISNEAAKWGKALQGGQQARRHQDAQTDELHRLVNQIKEEDQHER